MTKQNIFEGDGQVLLFGRGPFRLLAILKNILELEEWTDKNQELSQ
jgi:hypothetical protein